MHSVFSLFKEMTLQLWEGMGYFMEEQIIGPFYQVNNCSNKSQSN